MGTQPSRKQWREDACTPSDMAVRWHFGNWTKFIAQCGHIPLKVLPTKPKGIKNSKGVGKVFCHGYIKIFKPEHPAAMKNGYVREHRMVMYDAGLLIDLSHDVHHINEIKTDNRIENLMVLAKKDHTSLTFKGKKKKLNDKCKVCKKPCNSKYKLCTYHYRVAWAKAKKHEQPELLERLK